MLGATFQYCAKFHSWCYSAWRRCTKCCGANFLDLIEGSCTLAVTVKNATVIALVPWKLINPNG
jgi:hypothetical protein